MFDNVLSVSEYHSFGTIGKHKKCTSHCEYPRCKKTVCDCKDFKLKFSKIKFYKTLYEFGASFSKFILEWAISYYSVYYLFRGEAKNGENLCLIFITLFGLFIMLGIVLFYFYNGNYYNLRQITIRPNQTNRKAKLDKYK